MDNLIDTTEIYLKTVFEMEEDRATPLRVWTVGRLEHSDPTVSRTVNRMERDGLVHVLGDRRLELTPEGRRQVIEVMRKHRPAEHFLIDIIGLEWQYAHEEACRWEHTMSNTVKERLVSLLEDPKTDPYSNPIPGSDESLPDESLELVMRTCEGEALRLSRTGESIQTDKGIVASFAACEIKPGTQIEIAAEGNFTRLRSLEEGADMQGFKIPMVLASHLFVTL